MRTGLLLAAAMLAGCGGATVPKASVPTSVAVVRGIDHMPVAVGDLDAAADRFRALGFTLKPGRAHDNGIRNLHAKFADGSSIELITAPDAVDPLTAGYRAFLEGGDGPAYLALFAPDGAALSAALERFGARVEAGDYPGFVAGDPLFPYFFGARIPAANDRPEYFVHANGARGLIAAWVEDGPVRTLLAALGVPVRMARRCTPRCAVRPVATMETGELILLPRGPERPGGHVIVGATVLVTDPAALDTLLPTDTVRVGRSRFVRPEHANGMWLEMRDAAD